MHKLQVTSLALVLFVSGALFAAAMPQKADMPQKKDPAAEQKAMMDAMMRAGTPGEPHKKLNAMVGTFDANIKMWMAPGAKPTESAGKSVNEWVLGGRWVQQRFDGNFMGMPFSGLGYTGYDNVKHSYVGTWMDNMSTAVMTSSGNPDASGKVYSFTGMMSDPMSGEPSSVDEKVTVVDNDHHTMEMWGAGPDGNMYKMMEINYTRKK